MHLGELLRVRGDHAGALAAMVDGEREAARLGLRGSFGHFMYVNGADDLLRLGRWDEAAERLRRRPRGWTSRAPPTRCGARSPGSCTRCAGTSARRGARSTPPPTTDLPAEFLAPLAAARAALALAEGDPAAAAVHVDGALGGVEDPFYTAPLYALGLRVEAELAERERAHRRDAGRGARATSCSSGSRRSSGAAARRAGPARARPRRARARRRRPAPELWREAAAAFDALGEPYPPPTPACTRPRRRCWPAARRPPPRARSPPPAPPRRARRRPLREAAEALARRARLELAGATRRRARRRRRRADRRARPRCCGCSPTA